MNGGGGSPPLPFLFFLGLPAAGKSELRRYLARLDPAVARRDLGIGPTLHLDDYPYVHAMRRVAEELDELGADPVFFDDAESPFRDPRDWRTLTRLLAEDVAVLGRGFPESTPAAGWLLDRLDTAGSEAGLGVRLGRLPPAVRDALAAAIEREAATLRAERSGSTRRWDGSQTLLVEMARGGPEGATPPLPDPFGYRAALPLFPPAVLTEAAVLYVWVTPEESRRRNRERARPDGAASILHHGVPETVMRREYGVDDFFWLLEEGGGTHLPVALASGTVRLPAAVFDNREDRTTFLRADPATWPRRELTELHEALADAFGRLVAGRGRDGAR